MTCSKALTAQIVATPAMEYGFGLGCQFGVCVGVLINGLSSTALQCT
jgi:hypothetical protein